MSDRVFIRDYLRQYLDYVEPKDFYRSIFPEGDLEPKGMHIKGKYNAIAVELLSAEEQKKSKTPSKKFVITDELLILDRLLESNNFIIISPISYIGKSRDAANSRYIYAIAIDLDGITELQHLKDLFHQIEIEYIPKPTYIVWSGTGIHLYYQLINPIPCFDNIVKQLQSLKKGLTKRIWNMYTTSLSNKPQIQSLFQGFRLVGGVSKNNNRTEAFMMGGKVSIEYLNDFVEEEEQVKEFTYKSILTKEEAKEKYPEWYEKRIIQKQPKGTWVCKKDLYNWWLKKLRAEIKEGHRYYGLMCLAIYAKKSGISKEELEKDAFALFDFMETLTTDENNHFKQEDILAALELYNDSYITFPIDSITELTQIRIEKNKRNGLPQKEHLELARERKASLKRLNRLKKEGRPSKENEVKMWRKENPEGTKSQCIKETGISKNTVYKHWGD